MGEFGNFRLKCLSIVELVAQRLEQRTHNASASPGLLGLSITYEGDNRLERGE
jgi:hypothetical protein